jgi:phosphoribosylformylglycinamidine synthase
MTPYETLLSESQERMLVIVKKGKEKEVEDIFKKWDLHAVKIGEVTRGDKYRVLDGGKLAAEIPAKALADDGPVYTREEEKPAYLAEAQKLDLVAISEPQDFNGVLKRLLSYPSIASKVWVWRQYDHMVRTDTVFYPGHDASLIRIKGTQKGIAVSTDCNSLYVYLDPLEGGKIAVAEAARNVVCSGARPIGMTNCLNFGNPMKPEIFWQFHSAVSGIIESCKALEIPVTGGNVSFYNESPQGAIYPTPTIGMVGLLENIEKRVPSAFQNAGDIIFLAGETFNELGGSHYLMVEHGLKQGRPPRLDLAREKALHQFILAAADGKKLASCHDLSEGGLGVALAECCLKSAEGFGATVTSLDGVLKHQKGLRTDALYFGESQSRVLISVKPGHQKDVKNLAQKHGVALYEIGKVGGDMLLVEDRIRQSVRDLTNLFENTISNIMELK